MTEFDSEKVLIGMVVVSGVAAEVEVEAVGWRWINKEAGGGRRQRREGKQLKWLRSEDMRQTG